MKLFELLQEVAAKMADDRKLQNKDVHVSVNGQHHDIKYLAVHDETETFAGCVEIRLEDL